MMLSCFLLILLIRGSLPSISSRLIPKIFLVALTSLHLEYLLDEDLVDEYCTRTDLKAMRRRSVFRMRWRDRDRNIGMINKFLARS